MIRTNEFILSKKELIKLSMYQMLQVYKWWFIGLLLVTIYTATQSRTESLSRFMVIFCILYPILLIAITYFSVSAKSNKIFFKPRAYAFDEYKIHCILGEQTVVDAQIKGEYTYDSIIKKGHFSDYWLLYIAKGQAMPIPISAFQNETDLNRFIELINRKVK